MLLSPWATAVATAFAGAFLYPVAAGAMAFQDAPPPSCQVTLPSASSSLPATQVGIGSVGRVAAYGSEKLSTMLPIDGTWRGQIPTRPGDFAYSNKLPWRGAFTYKEGPLAILGKRLDGPAPSFIEIEPISGEQGIMGFISIPVFGCWQITGRYKDQKLSFLIWVTPIPEQISTSAQVQQPVEPSSTPRKVHVDSSKEAESLIYRVVPEIPHEARVVNLSGTVVLHATIGIDGRAHDLQYVSGPPLLARAAMDAVTWWQYRINELNVEVDTTIPVMFSTSEN